MKNIDILLDDTVEAEIVTDELTELIDRVKPRVEKIQRIYQKAVADSDIETLRVLDKDLPGKKTKNRTRTSTHNWTDKVRYAFLGAGLILGLIIGFIVGGITTVLIANVDSLNGVVSWIQLLIVLLFGGLGVFIADFLDDRRRQ